MLGLVLLLTISGQASAADDFVHLVRVTQQTVLRDRTVVPAGGEIAIRYDAGDGWVPYMEISLPFLAKSAATLVEQVAFDKPVNASVNKLTAVYQRVNFINSIASSVKPSPNGDILQAGEKVQIYYREGDYYIVNSNAFRFAMIPVGLLNVPPGALALGRVVPVPPKPAVTPQTATSTSPPRPRQLYGQLKVPYTLEGKILAAGNFVTVQYDAGDYWLLWGMSYENQPRIAKAAVDIVARTDFDVPLTARIKSPTTVYKFLPDLRNSPGSLEQSEGFANMNPTVRVGDQVYIDAREGNDYLIEVGGQGQMARTGRIPVSTADIIAGNPAAGVRSFVPPLPQSTNANAPGYVAPPPKRASPDDWMPLFMLFAVVSVIVGIAGALYRSTVNASTTMKGEADYGVPHAKYVATPDGFTVTFSKMSEPFYNVTHAWKNMKHTGGPLVAIAFIAMMIVLLFIVILVYGIECFFKTTITVDRETVKINGKSMARSDFGNFVVDHSLTGDEGEVAVLGYQFGRKTMPFGGVWGHSQAQEVASALNTHLRRAPMVGDEHSPSSEALRAARPSDF